MRHPHQLLIQFLGLLALGTIVSSPAQTDSGLAVAIVYDTSGSMGNTVRDASGKQAPKFRVANDALKEIIQRLERFQADHKDRAVHAGLFVFQGNGARAAIPMKEFEAAALSRWLDSFHSPAGATPLGTSVRVAADAVLKSDLPKKHVLVLTDGMNTRGPAPGPILKDFRRQSEQSGTAVFFHFVAFDVDSRAFTDVKAEGATLVEASDAAQLREKLNFILEEKILLEAE